jgi:hypothetical protein
MSTSRDDTSSNKFERANVVQAPARNPKQRLKEEYSNMPRGLNLVSGGRMVGAKGFYL